MMKLNFLPATTLLGLLMLTGIARAADAPPLPSWRAMDFEQRAFWATARAHLEISPGDRAAQPWHLRAIGSVVGKFEEVELDFDPVSWQVLHRSRLGQGKNRRFKTFDYTSQGILRERREPADDSATAPAQWQLTSRKIVDYPTPLNGRAVSDANLLPLIAERLQASGREHLEVVVHTDLNFYLVRMSCGDGITIPVDYQIVGAGPVSGQRPTRAVALNVSPLGPEAEKTDFNLLGLSGEIILLFDQASGHLLQIRGRAPRIGDTRINLISLTPRIPGI